MTLQITPATARTPRLRSADRIVTGAASIMASSSSAFQFVTALGLEKRFAVEEVSHHDVWEIGRQIIDDGGGEFGGGDHGVVYGGCCPNVPR